MERNNEFSPRRFSRGSYAQNADFLHPTNALEYDEDASPIQKRIEETVTNGRGYLSLQDSLDFVNKNPFYSNTPKIGLGDLIYNRLVPIDLLLPEKSSVDYNNHPCCERSIGSSEKVILPKPQPRTNLEKVRRIQEIEQLMENGKRRSANISYLYQRA